MRTITHLIDTKSVKKVIASMPDHWVVRELTERDYGIDLMVEVFIPGMRDAKGRKAYGASGAVFHIQIKGTQSRVRPEDHAVCYRIKKASLSYVEKFSVPFFLFRADVSSPTGKIYFVWIQRYIRDVLGAQDPQWRDKPGKTVTIEIPEANEIDTLNSATASKSFMKIQNIALRPKYLEELVEYHETFFDLDSRLSAISKAQYRTDNAALAELRSLAYRIRQLTVLLTENNCCVSRNCIDDVIQYLRKLRPKGPLEKAWLELPHRQNMTVLLRSIEGLATLENFVAANEGQTPY